MPKGPSGQKRKALSAPKSKKLLRKLPENSVSRADAIIREAANQAAGDLGNKITRGPKPTHR